MLIDLDVRLAILQDDRHRRTEAQARTKSRFNCLYETEALRRACIRILGSFLKPNGMHTYWKGSLRECCKGGGRLPGEGEIEYDWGA